MLALNNFVKGLAIQADIDLDITQRHVTSHSVTLRHTASQVAPQTAKNTAKCETKVETIENPALRNK